MDYLGWELERQRAALWALLGGGRAEDGEAPGEENTAWEGKALPGGRRRSPAGSGTARGNAVPPGAGRYAAKEGGEAGGPLAGAPGAWETVLAAEKALRSTGEDGAGETPEGPWGEISGKKAGFPARRDGGTEAGAFAASRQKEEAQGTAGEGTGSRTALEGPSGRREAGTGAAAAKRTAEAAETAAGGRRAGEGFAAEESAGEAGPASLRRSGGAAGGASIPPRRDGAGTARLGGGGLDGAPGREARLSRSFPWGEGWESPALRAEDGARALSKAVQRDARRYDGGFPIY